MTLQQGLQGKHQQGQGILKRLGSLTKVYNKKGVFLLSKLGLIHKRMRELNNGSASRNISSHSMAIEEFAKLIDDDEKIMFFSSGSRNGKNRLGMVFITNKRFILCLKLFMPYVEQFSYENITSVDYKKNIFNQGTIEINSYGDKVKFGYYETEKLVEAVRYIQKRMLDAKQPAPSLKVDKEDDNDAITKIERLAALLEKDFITKEEFDAQKSLILSGKSK